MRLRAAGLATRTLGDEIVVLDLRSSRYLAVTGVGVDIVSMLSEDRTEDELVAALLDKYDVEENVLRRDAGSFLDQLRGAGLLES